MRFVTKSKEHPEDIEKAKVVSYDIFIPQYLLSLLIVVCSHGLVVRSWDRSCVRSGRPLSASNSSLSSTSVESGLSFYSNTKIISDAEMSKLENAKVADIWDGRIESLLHVSIIMYISA